MIPISCIDAEPNPQRIFYCQTPLPCRGRKTVSHDAPLCAECKQPIDDGKPYFWGRMGGEWHPLCLHAAETTGPNFIAYGMWMPTDDVPVEYKLAKRGLVEGAGI